MNEGKGSILSQTSKNIMSISLLTHLSCFCLTPEMLKQWKSDEDSTKDMIGKVEGVLINWIEQAPFMYIVIYSNG